MKINHNMAAVMSNNKLKNTEGRLQQSIERLSSGLKLNRASDNAAGMAISTRMSAQIAGLGQASRNSLDGVSVIETAEGAITEVVSMIQRMRELSVQAANGTMSLNDREAIQNEIDALATEINRISKDTEFNAKPLLDGSLDQRCYTNNRLAKVTEVGDGTHVGDYQIKITQDARQAVVTGREVSPAEIAGINGGTIPAGKILINGVEVEIAEGSTPAEVYMKLREAGEAANVNVIPVDDTTAVSVASGNDQDAGYKKETFDFGSKLAFISNEYGSKANVQVTCNDPDLAKFLGIGTDISSIGIDVEAEFISGPKTATITTDGDKILISDRGGSVISVKAQTGIAGTIFTDKNVKDAAGTVENGTIVEDTTITDAAKTVDLQITDIGTMTLQIGANENQLMEVKIPAITTETLDLMNLNVRSEAGAGKGIKSLDDALSKVSGIRSKLGAYQNRLDHAIASLDISEENLTGALSRIEDVDMAKEMTEYTQLNVLTQAATSVLAQANEQPQKVLQLLG